MRSTTSVDYTKTFEDGIKGIIRVKASPKKLRNKLNLMTMAQKVKCVPKDKNYMNVVTGKSAVRCHTQ